MLKIRLQRTGRTNDPSYRVVVTEHQNGPKAGKAVAQVGSYNPKAKTRVLDGEAIKYWLSVGAQASGTVHNMLISAGIITGKKINVLPKKTVPKKDLPAQAGEPAAEAAPKAAAPAESNVEEAAPETAPEVTEAPVSESKEEASAQA